METMTGKMQIPSLKSLLTFAILLLSTSIVQAAVNISYVHTDHLGTPQVMTDENQNVVWKADYDPFGSATVDPSSTITNNIRGLGQYYDEETGLYYNLNRYLDPSIGRYTQSDLIGLEGGNNTYGYALQNPINYFDFNGAEAEALLPLVPAIPTAAEIAAAAAAACTTNPLACIAASGAAGYGIGTLIYPAIEVPLGNAIDAICRDDPTAEECEEEWRKARARCRQLIFEQLEQQAGRRKKRSVTGVTGGFTDVEKCARGLVSEACGGNPVE